MPIYDWIDTVSEKQVTVFRHKFDDYLIPPSEKEAINSGMEEQEAKDAKWKKIISKGTRIVKTSNWGAGKGNW